MSEQADLKEETERLKAVNAALVQALEDLLPWIERGRERLDRDQSRAITQALAAIREARGQAGDAGPATER